MIFYLNIGGGESLKNQTKLLFAQKLEEMLQTIPMDKIRIIDLCKRCETIPQTFYYHFHDKYELVAWIFLYDFSKVYGDKSQNTLLKVLSEVWNRWINVEIFINKPSLNIHKIQSMSIFNNSMFSQLHKLLKALLMKK